MSMAVVVVATAASSPSCRWRRACILLVAAAVYAAGEVGVEMVSGWWFERNGQGLTMDLLTSVEEFRA
jgi:hypothetical protein